MATTTASALSAVRSRGALGLTFRRLGDRTVAGEMYQSGCLRVRLPRLTMRSGEGEAVLINAAGGLAEGDVLEQRIGWEAGACAAITSQAAERVYRAMDVGARVSTRLTLAAGADAAWMPQETILFDAARLSRAIEVEMAPDARFLGLEAVVLGRAAMGERMETGHLRDTWRIRRDGRLIYADALELGADSAVAATMTRPALGAGAFAFATVLRLAPDAAALLDPLRQALTCAQGRVAASSWNGILALRLLAPDGAVLRHDLALALKVLRDGLPPPRVWSC